MPKLYQCIVIAKPGDE